MRLNESMAENMHLLKRENAKLKAKLDQNWDEIKTLWALVEAIQEQHFPTPSALQDPSAHPMVECVTDETSSHSSLLSPALPSHSPPISP